jgi:hypothetical protein
VKPKEGGIASLRAPPPEPFALMAAAQMHADGRLIPPKPDTAPLDIRTDTQKQHQNDYQPNDPKNTQRELINKGIWQGDSRGAYSSDVEGLY